MNWNRMISIGLVILNIVMAMLCFANWTLTHRVYSLIVGSLNVLVVPGLLWQLKHYPHLQRDYKK